MPGSDPGSVRAQPLTPVCLTSRRTALTKTPHAESLQHLRKRRKEGEFSLADAASPWCTPAWSRPGGLGRTTSLTWAPGLLETL